MVADVAGVFAVGDDGEIALEGQRGQMGEQLVFAEIAAVGRVGEIVGVIEFGGANDAQRDGELGGNGHGLLQLAPREAGGIRDNGQGFIAQDLAGDKGQENGINAAGIGHQARAIGAQDALQLC